MSAFTSLVLASVCVWLALALYLAWLAARTANLDARLRRLERIADRDRSAKDENPS